MPQALTRAEFLSIHRMTIAMIQMRTLEEVKEAICSIEKGMQFDDLVRTVVIIKLVGDYKEKATRILHLIREYRVKRIVAVEDSKIPLVNVITNLTEERRRISEQMRQLIDKFLVKEC